MSLDHLADFLFVHALHLLLALEQVVVPLSVLHLLVLHFLLHRVNIFLLQVGFHLNFNLVVNLELFNGCL